MTATPNPTNQEFYDALQLTDQRVSIAASELLARLKANLPDKISYLNSQLGYQAGYDILPPEKYLLAPSIIDDGYLNTLLLSLATDYGAQGPGAFKSTHTVTIFCIEPPSSTDRQVRLAFEKAACIRAVLRHFMNGCIDSEGRYCWHQLIPVSMAPLPNDWDAGFFGTTNTFRMVIQPSNNNWS